MAMNIRNVLSMGLFVLISVCTFSSTVPSGSLVPLADEILWDTFGIPHIYATNSESLFYQFGAAQMHSHGDLILRLYGQARGRASEYWGQDYWDSDEWVWTMGVPKRAADWWRIQRPEGRQIIASFVQGMNDYANKHTEKLNKKYQVVLPIKPEDVLAHLQRVLHFTFVVNPEEIKMLRSRRSDKGSNAWAVAPERSASGNALLLANPHLPWGDLFTWYEAQWVTTGVNAYGVALVGQPLLGIAFNDFLGWTHTVNTIDAADIFELTLSGSGYLFDGKIENFQSDKIALKVRQPDGSTKMREIGIRKSIHGPIVHSQKQKAYALRVAGLDQPHIASQYWNMIQATNMVQFERALRELQMPLFTVMYADHEGHIMHLFGGSTPIRPPGNYDWRGIVPGSTSATYWDNTHGYDDLPRVADPRTGWLQNANDPPWTTTVPAAINPDDYPRYMAPRGMSFRAQRSARLLAEDTSLTFDEFIQNKLSTRMELADRLLDDLQLAVAKYGSDKGKKAISVLSNWDRCADNDSRGAILFSRWIQELRRQSNGNPFVESWDQKEPLTTPRRLSNPEQAAKILETAADAVEKEFGKLDIAWGEIHRLRDQGVDLPANGGSGDLGIFRVTGFDKASDGKFVARSGDGYVAAIEFSKPVRAMALLTYGNSSQPGSSHRTDQLFYYSRKELRAVWRSRSEIEAHLEERW